MAKGSARRVHGLFTALITPFDAKGRVDADRLANLVRFQVSKGVDGIYPCGSTGLGPMLKVEERKLVAETVVRTAGSRVPVVVQVGSADTASTVELAEHAEDAGAYAVASLTPYYYKPGDRATMKHFEAVSKAVEIPVLAYNIPHFTGNNLTPNLVAELSRAGIAGLKDSSRDFLQLLDVLSAVPDEFVVMNGIEEYGLFAIMSGADGLVSGGASALPELFSRMVGAQAKGDREAALASQRTVQQVKELVKVGPISAYYEILRARGLDCGAPRPPLLPMEKSASEAALAGLRRLGVL
ncbi:MAG TPA: dihydrodipicolinate synthase family protein [Nitrososphaerales archaeon]|nr:dihydrodipicolinate synthase family protein [Nitrososphaerales archaeon]